ncbi:MAG: IS481 family transposase [Acidimicrobiales bacterium]
MSHAKAKLTPAGRLLLVRRVLDEGWPPSHAAAMAGVSRPTVYKWLRRFADEGLVGLNDRPSRATRCPHRTSPEIEAAIVEARRASRRGPRRIANRLGMAPSTVHAVLARHGVSRLSRLDRTTGTPIRYERATPGELIHVDVKKLGRVPDGGGWRAHGRERGRAGEHRTQSTGFDYLHVAVDDHSRYAYVEVHANETGETCAGFMDRTLERFAALGVRVQRVMTDNALNYTRASAFHRSLGWIRHVRIRPYRPQTNGKAERFNRTLVDEWAYDRPYQSNAERLGALEEFLVDYNYVRTHSGIGDRPPASRLP